MQTISIGTHSVGPQQPPFIVAELSANHLGSYERALKLVEAAKAAGAHAVKLQTYTADTMTLNIRSGEFLITDPKSLWVGRSLYDLYQEAATPWEWHGPLFQRIRELGMEPFSTPFDDTAVDFLEQLQVPCYKIASLEIMDHPLIRKAASTGKPLIISTGAATFAEIQEAVAVARNSGCHQLILLKCTSAYPAPIDQSNLRSLPYFASNFNVLTGFSDHTPGIGAALASIALGACLIEKHLTLSRADGGVDAAFSLEPAEFKNLVLESQRAWQALGTIQESPGAAEISMRTLRRSLYFVQDIPAGTTISATHIRAIRPGSGLSPKEYQAVLGCKLKQDVRRGQPVQWELLLKEV